MFAHLTRADLARVEREAPAQLAARFTTDAATIREALTRAVNGIADAVTIIGLVGWMIYADWVLCLIAGVLLPIAAVPIQRIGRRMRRASGGMQERVGETAALLNESFAQARTVRAYRLEAAGDRAAPRRRSSGSTGRCCSMTRSRAPHRSDAGDAGRAWRWRRCMGFAGWRAALGTSSIGDFAGFVAALLIASRPLRALGTLNAALQEGLAGLVARVRRDRRAADHRRARRAPTPLPPGRGRVVFERCRASSIPTGGTGCTACPSSPSPG